MYIYFDLKLMLAYSINIAILHLTNEPLSHIVMTTVSCESCKSKMKVKKKLLLSIGYDDLLEIKCRKCHQVFYIGRVVVVSG
jgi:phage FluMu protein Com